MSRQHYNVIRQLLCSILTEYVVSSCSFLYARLQTGRIMVWWCPSVRPSQFSALFSYMLWDIELKFCLSLYYDARKSKFECHQFPSIFDGVMPLFNFKLLQICSFPHFSPSCFDISSWNLAYDFVLLYYRTSSSVDDFRQFLLELCPFWNLDTWWSIRGSCWAIWSNPLTNVKWHSDPWPTVTSLPIRLSTNFNDLYTELDLHRIMSGFHGAFATGVASQQGTLTLPDTWFRPPFWDLLMLLLLRPNSSNLPCLYSTFHLEYPLVLSRFYLEYWKYTVFRTFLLHALTYWAEILHLTLFYCTTDQVSVLSISVNFCRSYAPFGT